MRRRLKDTKGRPKRDHCGHSGKTRYRSKGAAREALFELRRKGIEESDPNRGECRFYFCIYSAGFHLTSKGRVA